MAYADFVTAMMAFFLVMWLVGQNPEVKAAVAGYFRDPGVFDHAKSDGMITGGEARRRSRTRAGKPVPPPDPSVLAQERAQLQSSGRNRFASVCSPPPDLTTRFATRSS